MLREHYEEKWESEDGIIVRSEHGHEHICVCTRQSYGQREKEKFADKFFNSVMLYYVVLFLHCITSGAFTVSFLWSKESMKG